MWTQGQEDQNMATATDDLFKVLGITRSATEVEVSFAPLGTQRLQLPVCLIHGAVKAGQESLQDPHNKGAP